MSHRSHILLAVLLSVGMATFFAIDPAEAQQRERRVEFRLSVESSDDGLSPELRVRKATETSAIVVERIEARLDAVNIKNHRVRVDDSNNIHVTVYGLHSPDAIKSAVIPPGRLEIRPVIVDNSLWYDLEDSLPSDIEVRNEPGSFQTDRIFLFSPSARSLRNFISRISLSNTEILLFPHDQGWRTLNLGPVLATHRNIESVEIDHTPSSIPFIKAQIDSDAVEAIRSHTSGEEIRYLALVLDGEPINLYRFSARQFSSELILDTPDFLRTSDAREFWAIQVAGRLATPLPITLIEIED